MWQGVPFKLLSGNLSETTSIIVSKIPHIIVESNPDYLGQALTTFAALFGGGMTAFVALKAINANKKQMLQQQAIIERQKFIDELRSRLAFFLANAEKLCVTVDRDVKQRMLMVSGAPFDTREKLSQIAYELDISYHYLELMLGDNKNFLDVIELINVIEKRIAKMLQNGPFYNIDKDAAALKETAIRCIQDEWESVHSSFK